MKRSTKSLLETLNEVHAKKQTENVIETRASHIIDSAINLLSLIRESFDAETAYELERRFLNSIRGSDPSKFTRGIRKIRDSKETLGRLKILEGDLKDED